LAKTVEPCTMRSRASVLNLISFAAIYATPDD
jgi:hypothetical protein